MKRAYVVFKPVPDASAGYQWVPTWVYANRRDAFQYALKLARPAMPRARKRWIETLGTFGWYFGSAVVVPLESR